MHRSVEIAVNTGKYAYTDVYAYIAQKGIDMRKYV